MKKLLFFLLVAALMPYAGILAQDVTTVEVEKDESGETQVQVVGDVYMYGSNCIVQPVYVSPPVIFVFFRGPLYHPWRSPYHYGYYPPYYRPWRPYPTPYCRSNVHVHVNTHNSYHRTSIRYSNNAINLQKQVKRNDYARANPNKSFQARNKGVKNSNELNRNRKNDINPSTGPTNKNGRPVNKDWKPSSERKANTRPSNNKSKAKPSQRPTNSQPAKKPFTAKPTQKPSNVKPSQKPATKKPSTQPTTTKPTNTKQKPAARPNNTSKQRTTPKRTTPKGGRR